MILLVVFLIICVVVGCICILRVEEKIDALIHSFYEVTGVDVDVKMDRTKFEDFTDPQLDPFNKAFEGEPKDRRIENETASM